MNPNKNIVRLNIQMVCSFISKESQPSQNLIDKLQFCTERENFRIHLDVLGQGFIILELHEQIILLKYFAYLTLRTESTFKVSVNKRTRRIGEHLNHIFFSRKSFGCVQVIFIFSQNHALSFLRRLRGHNGFPILVLFHIQLVLVNFILEAIFGFHERQLSAKPFFGHGAILKLPDVQRYIIGKSIQVLIDSQLFSYSYDLFFNLDQVFFLFLLDFWIVFFFLNIFAFIIFVLICWLLFQLC